MRLQSALLGPNSKEGDQADVDGENCSTLGVAGKGESNIATRRRASFGAASRGSKANITTGNRQSLGEDTTAWGCTSDVRIRSWKHKQKSRSKRKHTGRRVMLHRKKDKIQHRRAWSMYMITSETVAELELQVKC